MGKWVSIVRWLVAREAEQLIMDGIKRAKSPKSARKTAKKTEKKADKKTDKKAKK